MKHQKPVTHKDQKEREYIAIQSWSVTNCRDTQYGAFLDLTINGVTIYGVKVVDGKEGVYDDFLAMPSRKGKDAAGGDRYYNIVYAPISPDDTKTIIAEIERQLDERMH